MTTSWQRACTPRPRQAVRSQRGHAEGSCCPQLQRLRQRRWRWRRLRWGSGRCGSVWGEREEVRAGSPGAHDALLVRPPQVSKVKTVNLWLGADIMVEYSLEEAKVRRGATAYRVVVSGLPGRECKSAGRRRAPAPCSGLAAPIHRSTAAGEGTGALRSVPAPCLPPWPPRGLIPTCALPLLDAGAAGDQP